jgi:DNA polymerase-3 subunit delta'
MPTCVLMPEALSLALGWPLNEKTQDELDGKSANRARNQGGRLAGLTVFTRSPARGRHQTLLVFDRA